MKAMSFDAPRTTATLLVAVLCLTTLAPAARGDASGATPVAPPLGAAAPVTINSCGPIINDHNSTTNVLGFPIPASTSSGIKIEFVNESKVAATLVNFAVDSGGDHFVIRDVGTFSPGVSIKHQYRNGAGQAFVLPAFISPNVTCHVASVQFADGSLWRKGQQTAAAPAPAATSAPVLWAFPAQITIDRGTDSELFLVDSARRVTAFKEIDDCAKVATVSLATSGDSSATYSVKPVAAGSCTAHVIDEAGNTISVPIAVQ